MKSLIFLLVISVGLFSADGKRYKLVCYFLNLSQYRTHPYRYFPTDIDPHLCTHIIYAFGRLSGNAILPYEWNDESTPWSTGHYQEVINLKQHNPRLKVLLGLADWTQNSEPFSQMAATDENIAEFTQNAIAYLRGRNFDGIDFDWEYPGSRQGTRPIIDRHRYSILLRETRKAFEDESNRTGQEQLLLAAALPAGKTKIDNGYELAVVGRYLDFVNVMSYDYHGQWDDYVGLNAPLYGREGEEGDAVYLNQNWTLNYYIDNGIPREKLIMGLATYGRSFTLRNSLNNNIGSLAIRGGNRGTYTRKPGYLAYYEICQGLQANVPNQWTREWDEQQLSPYAYWRDQWVGYDDQESMENKTQYIVTNGLGGAMVWELASDDFRNVCNQGTYPLIRTIKSVLDAAQTTTTVPTTESPPSRVEPRTNGSIQNFDELCTEAGMLLPYNPDCSLYVQCAYVTPLPPVWYVMPCQPGLYFRKDTSYCDFPGTVPDCPLPGTLSTQVALNPGRGGAAPPSIELTTSPEPTVTTPPYELNKPRAGFDGNTSTESNPTCDPVNRMAAYRLDCSKYVTCVLWNLQYVMPCPYGLYYNTAGYCDWPENVPECNY